MTAFAIVLVAAIYFVPSIVAFARNDPRGVPVMAWNIFTGWTVAGWLILLVVVTRPIARAELPVAAEVRGQYGRHRS